MTTLALAIEKQARKLSATERNGWPTGMACNGGSNQ